MNQLKFGNFLEMSYACKEAINTLCTNLSFSGEDVRKIMITSCHEAEGKSYISMNIMRTMAELGKKVALVDADLRRSMINKNYKVKFADADAHKGLTHLLAGMATEEEVIYKTNIRGAYFVPVGREVNNSLALLVSPKFESLLNRLAEAVDYVIVDTPPVGTIIDASEISKSCDGSLIVVNYNAIRRQELLSVKSQLERTNCKILGTVLNRVEYKDYMNRKYYYRTRYYNYYRKGYYYTKSEEDAKADKE